MKNNRLWIVALSILEAGLIYLMLSGEIANFLHPKMNKFVFFAIVALGILIFTEMYLMIFDKESLVKGKGSAMFILPIIMLFVFSPNAMDATNNPEKLGKVDFSKPQILEPDEYVIRRQEVEPKEVDEAEISEKTDETVTEAIDRINNGFVQTEDHVPELVDLTSNQFDYIEVEGGKFKDALAKAYTVENSSEEVEIFGFAYKQEDMEDNQMSISRLLMSCCAQDTSIIGLLCDISDYKDKFEESSWYSVKGTIDHTQVFNENTQEYSEVPILKVKEVVASKAPISPFVYP